MIPPSIPENEEERLSALHSYNIMDSLPERDYDNLTKIASEICQTRVAMITFMDRERQWFKSKTGVELTENQRDFTFCAHGMLDPQKPLVVNNPTEDPRFMGNPLVTGPHNVRFYAGVQLVDKNGFPLGSICVLDIEEKEISESQLATLKILGDQVVRLLELRKTITDLENNQQDLLRTNRHLKDYDYVISHDLKAPLRNMKHLAEAVKDSYSEQLDDKGKKYLQLMNDTAKDAISYVNGILSYSQAIQIDTINEAVDLQKLVTQIIEEEQTFNHLSISVPDQLPVVFGSKAVFRQIFSNLINNAIKYHDKETGWIKILYFADENHHNFQVVDNGQGIPEEKLGSVFALFFMVDKEGTKNSKSSGVGLSIVKNLITEMKGKILVKSTLGEGTTFKFFIPK